MPRPAKPVYIVEMLLKKDWWIEEHVHPQSNQLLVILGGRIRTEIHGNTYESSPGTVVVYPHGKPHTEWSIGRGALRMLLLEWRDGSDLSAHDLPCQMPDANGRIETALRWLLDVTRRWDMNMDNPACVGLLQTILHEVHHLSTHRPAGLADRALAYLKEHISEPITLDDLSDDAALSRFHFAKCFQEEVGQSPMAWLRARRVESAVALIRSSSMPLQEVAEQTGFRDGFHLSRVVKQITGKPPSAFREIV